MKCQIIAEIGWNHMGDMVLAKEMISAAAEVGADFAKFQTWSTQNLKSGAWDEDGRVEIYKKAELSREQHFELANFSKKNGIRFLTSVFNINDVKWLHEVGTHAIKVPSHEVYNLELISKLDGVFDNIFISTGASDWAEVKSIPAKIKKSQLSLFHCVSSYPCPPEKVNLPRIRALRKIVASVGYSGHFFGIDDALGAIGFGVDYVEKHFTLDRELPGRDNKFAVLPEELKKLCDYRDNYIAMMTDLGNSAQDCEQDVIDNYRGRWSN